MKRKAKKNQGNSILFSFFYEYASTYNYVVTFYAYYEPFQSLCVLSLLQAWVYVVYEVVNRFNLEKIKEGKSINDESYMERM